MFGLKIKETNTSNFHPLEVVDRGTSETQLQVGENLYFYIVLYGFRDHSVCYLS